MPTPIPQQYIDNFLAIVKAVSYSKWQQILPNLVNYEDIADALGVLLSEIDGNPPLLTELMDSFPVQAPLNAVGIYVGLNLTSPPTVLNITYSGTNFLINCNLAAGVSVGFIPSPPPSPVITSVIGVVLLNSTIIAGGVTVNSGFTLFYLYLGSGTSLDYLDSTQTGSFTNQININNYNSNPATLGAILINSNYANLIISDGAIFGGVTTYPLDNTCNGMITGLLVANPPSPASSHNTIGLIWTPPTGNYIGISVWYKLTQSPEWILANTDNGDFIWASVIVGFTFRNLLPDTSYDFGVIVTCNDGGNGPMIKVLSQSTSATPA